MTEQELKKEIFDILYVVKHNNNAVNEGMNKILSLLDVETLLTLLKEKTGCSLVQLDRPQAVCKDCDKIWHECECPVKIYVKEEEINK